MRDGDELLTIEQFAEKLNISRSTVFEWIKSETLKPGIHYLKIKRMVRFIWGDELIGELKTITTQQHLIQKRPPAQCASPAKKRHSHRFNTQANLDYM